MGAVGSSFLSHDHYQRKAFDMLIVVRGYDPSRGEVFRNEKQEEIVFPDEMVELIPTSVREAGQAFLVTEQDWTRLQTELDRQLTRRRTMLEEQIESIERRRAMLTN